MTGHAYSTRRFTFAAAHHYRVAGWSDEANRRAFGALTTPHGHNYTLDVTVRGTIDETTGMVIDLGELKRVVNETVIERFDHADLNADPAFRDRVPTAENIAVVVWTLLEAKLGAERLFRVRVWEDPTLYVDYWGP